MTNILIGGVGGQGSLLASQLLGKLFLARGLDVKVSEVHGMSQRGGSVVTYVRAGQQVAWPLIEPGEVDLLIALEGLEALRWAHHVKRGGAVAASSQRINPMPVLTGAAAYPDDLSPLHDNDRKVVLLDAADLAVQAGSARCANVVLLGAASTLLDFSLDEWQAVLDTLPEKIKTMNKTAFDLGRSAAGV